MANTSLDFLRRRTRQWLEEARQGPAEENHLFPEFERAGELRFNWHMETGAVARTCPLDISGKPINKEGYLEDAFRSKAYQRLYPAEKPTNYPADNECPNCDQLVEETVGFHQHMLLGPRQDMMNDIANAVAKIYENRRRLLEAT